MKIGLHNEYKPGFNGSFIGSNGIMTNEEVCGILSEIIQAPSVNPDESICGRKIIEICEREGLNYEVIPVDTRRDDEADSGDMSCNNECASGDMNCDVEITSADMNRNNGKCYQIGQTADNKLSPRFNIMITLGADSYLDKTAGLMIHGHYDTVPVMEMEDPFGARIIDNEMYGRGAVDQKSGLVSALCAAIAIKRSGVKLCKPLCIAAVVDEESEHRGSYTLGMSGMKADYAIVTEPTNVHRCEFGCRGTTPVKITVKGKTAHAGAPWKGINSIEKAMPILSELFSMKFPELDLGELGILKSTLCVSMIDGGSAYNNVPGETVIWMDRRTIPGETNESALEEIRLAVQKAVNNCAGWDDPIRQVAEDGAGMSEEDEQEKFRSGEKCCSKPDKSNPKCVSHAESSGTEEIKQIYDERAAVKVEIARPDWHWDPIRRRGLNPTLTDPDCPLYDVLVRAAAECGIAGIEKSLFEGYNDMDFLVNELGIPTLIYGPGDAQMCHAPVEKVDIDDVCRVAEVFCNVAMELLTDVKATKTQAKHFENQKNTH